MGIDELCSLPVEALAAKDCLLFLWATFPMLPEALQLIRAWGFTFKTVAFVWLKQNRKSPTWFYGLGYWTRGNAEICLLAKRGKPKRHSAAVHQFITPALNAHTALRGAPTSMGRGEIPVELMPSAVRFMPISPIL